MIALANLEYNGSTSADTFEITVSTIIQRLKENNINVSDRLACQLILKGLSGDFKYLRNQYRTKTNMKLSQLFAEIQLIYDENKIMNLNKPSQYKQHSEYKMFLAHLQTRLTQRLQLVIIIEQIVQNQEQQKLTILLHLVNSQG